MSQNLGCQDGNEYFSQFKLSMEHSKVRGAGHQTEELSHKNATFHDFQSKCNAGEIKMSQNLE